ncbi:hypothetical protein AAFN86_07750 [Roseomonas sp. CAU 1739]|uniref:hypothetical protein n=1 Tax=Roseomonas sp. CAU 1739 TaxID=3140364 RepID=UPI00325A6B9E
MCTTSKQIMGWTLGLLLKAQNEGNNKLMGGALTKGGAEGWVQVELDDIYKTLPNTSWVQREQYIYVNPLEAVDFLICCSSGALTCIELKVESLFHTAKLGRVTMDHKGWQIVHDDVVQLAASNRKADFQAASAYAVAIVWSEEATLGMDHWLSQRMLAFEREQILVNHDGGQYRVTVYVIEVTG